MRSGGFLSFSAAGMAESFVRYTFRVFIPPLPLSLRHLVLAHPMLIPAALFLLAAPLVITVHRKAGTRQKKLLLLLFVCFVISLLPVLSMRVSLFDTQSERFHCNRRASSSALLPSVREPAIPFVVFAAFVVMEDRLKNRYTVSMFKRIPALIVFLAPIYFSPLTTGIIKRWENSVPAAQLCFPETNYATAGHSILEAIPWWVSIKYMSAVAGSLPSGIKIAATEYGYIASENTHAVIIDMAGLHDMELAQSGFSSASILSRRPDIVWMPHTDYTCFRTLLLDDPVFYENYAFYPEVFNYGVALRLNSRYFSEMQTTLDSVFSLAYPRRELSEFLASVQPIR